MDHYSVTSWVLNVTALFTNTLLYLFLIGSCHLNEAIHWIISNMTISRILETVLSILLATTGALHFEGDTWKYNISHVNHTLTSNDSWDKDTNRSFYPLSGFMLIIFVCLPSCYFSNLLFNLTALFQLFYKLRSPTTNVEMFGTRSAIYAAVVWFLTFGYCTCIILFFKVSITIDGGYDQMGMVGRNYTTGLNAIILLSWTIGAVYLTILVCKLLRKRGYHDEVIYENENRPLHHCNRTIQPRRKIWRNKLISIPVILCLLWLPLPLSIVGFYTKLIQLYYFFLVHYHSTITILLPIYWIWAENIISKTLTTFGRKCVARM